MKIQVYSVRLIICTIALWLVSSSVAFSQDKNKPAVSEPERLAAAAVRSAADINAKMTAADDFVKKFPKSSLRADLAEYIVNQILDVTSPEQKLALAQKYPAIFSAPAEVDQIKPALIDVYVKTNKFDEAFAEGAAYLGKHTEDIQVLVLLAITGVEQAKAKNPKFVNASRQYGAKAIELFEADKKAANMDPEVWARVKTNLPQIYQEMAIISLMEQKPAEAQAKLEKAIGVNKSDPFNYMLLGSIINDEYQKLAQAYKTMAEGKEREDMMTKINVLLDKVIDYYAHGVGLSEGKPEYQNFHDQLLQDLASYYRYRHKNSTDGLQELINTYKLP